MVIDEGNDQQGGGFTTCDVCCVSAVRQVEGLTRMMMEGRGGEEDGEGDLTGTAGAGAWQGNRRDTWAPGVMGGTHSASTGESTWRTEWVAASISAEYHIRYDNSCETAAVIHWRCHGLACHASWRDSAPAPSSQC